MAVTSEASSVTNFTLRTFNTGPGYLREMTAVEHQSVKKSATERLTESRSKFVRRGSQDELEENQGHMHRARQVYVTPTQDDKQGHVYRAVPHICGSDATKSPQAGKKFRPQIPPPVPDKPSQPGLMGVRRGGRDRTLEIVEASLAHRARQNTSSDDDAVFFPSQGIIASVNSSNSNSPQSLRESSSAGSRVRRLKEQFLNLGSTESESDTSQGAMTPTDLQKSGSSSSSPHELKRSNLISHQKDTHRSDSQDQTGSDVIKRIQLQAQYSPTLAGKPKLRGKTQVEADNLTKSLGTGSEEDPSHKSEHGMKSETRQASVSSSDVLTEQTRRQMEHFKARYATDFTKERNQERKINKIILKPHNQTTERSERSSSLNEPPHKTSSSLVGPMPHTSKDESTSWPVETGKELFVRPQVHSHIRHIHITETDRKPTENAKQVCTSQKSLIANRSEGSNEVDQDISKKVTSEDVRRLRRAKEYNVSGKSPERWGDAEETNKTQTSVPGHAVHHAGDRVLVQVSGGVFPTKHHVSNKSFQTRLQPEDTMQLDSPLEVIHRRAKSDLDQSCAARSSMKTDASSHRVRHRSQDDQLQQEPLIPESIRKASAPHVFLAHARPSPEAITDFQKKSWAPISFNQNQDKNYINKRNTGQGSHCHHGSNALSSDIPKVQTNDTNLQTPRNYARQNTPRMMSSENTHTHAKSTVQSFLSGIMTSPESRKIPIGLKSQKDTNKSSQNLHPPHLHNDGNGNRIASEFSAPELPPKLIHSRANINEASQSVGEEDNDKVNSNVYFSTETQNKPGEVSSRDVTSTNVELIAVCDQRDPHERLQDVSKDTQAHAVHRTGYIIHQDKGKIHHMEHSELMNVEADKRRKFSQNSDTSSSKQDGVHQGQKEVTAKVEEPRVKKISLAELLSKDAIDGRTDPSDNTDQLKRAEVKKLSRDAANSKWSRPPKPNRSHGDDSETDSDIELQRSKVLRVRRPQRRAENKKEDKSLQNLLSRIINPEDELNTLKRGQKPKAPKNTEPPATRKSNRTTFSSSTGESENEARMDKVFSTRYKSTSKTKNNENIEPNVRKPLLNLNLKQGSNNSRALKREDPKSPPESLTSPTRRDFFRHRSKSDLGLSPRCSVSSTYSDMEHFFNQMGLNESFFQKPLSPAFQFSDEDEVFHEMHEYKHTRGDDGGSFSTENSDNISHGTKVSEEGLHLAKKLPDASQSIITKNARVIKWLCQMRKARSSSFS